MRMLCNVGKAVEAGLMLVAVSSLLLVGCGGGGGGGNAGVNTTTNAFITALTDGVGLRSLSLGASPVVATVNMATAGPAGSYTVTGSEKVLSGSAWQARASVVTDYFLSASGTWVDNTAPSVLTPNGDGTVTVDGIIKGTLVAVDMSGKDLNAGASYNLVNPAISGGSAVVRVGAMPSIPPGSTYPAGSVAWITTGAGYLADYYSLGVSAPLQVKTPAGNLTALNLADASSFTLSNPLCSVNVRLVYSATQPAPANYARFDVYPMTGCAAIAAGTPDGTVDLTYKTVRTQPVAQFSNYTGSVANAWIFSIVAAGNVEPAFVAVVNGGVWPGYMFPAGTVGDLLVAASGSLQVSGFNKTAMDAITTAARLPNF